MKKKLDEILSKAVPSELDSFSEELGERKLAPEVLSSVKNKVFERTGLKNTRKTPKAVWLRLTAAAACFCIIVTALTVLPRVLSGGANTTYPQGTERPLLWDDINSFFGNNSASSTTKIEEAVMVEEVIYKIQSGRFAEYKSGIVIDEEYIDRKIDKVTVRSAWFRHWDKSEHDIKEVKAEVYTIKGLRSDIAVAIKYLDKPTAGTTTHYYTFKNPSVYLEADTVSSLLSEYNAEEYMKVSTFGLSAQIEVNGGEKSLYRVNEELARELMDMTLALRSGEAYYAYTQDNLTKVESIIKACKVRMRFIIDVVPIKKSASVYVLDNGYVCIVGLSQSVMLFEVGKSATEPMISAVRNKAELYTPSYNNGSEETVTYAVTSAAEGYLPSPNVNE